jgi:hypothetical protein
VDAPAEQAYARAESEQGEDPTRRGWRRRQKLSSPCSEPLALPARDHPTLPEGLWAVRCSVFTEHRTAGTARWEQAGRPTGHAAHPAYHRTARNELAEGHRRLRLLRGAVGRPAPAVAVAADRQRRLVRDARHNLRLHLFQWRRQHGRERLPDGRFPGSHDPPVRPGRQGLVDLLGEQPAGCARAARARWLR